MTPEEDEIRLATALNQAANQAAIQSQVTAIRQLLFELSQKLGEAEISARCDNLGFRHETKKALESMLLKMGDKDPDFVRKIYARLKQMGWSPDDPDSTF